MTLTERTGELSDLDNILVAASAGRGQVVVIRGGLASGKTALVHELGELLRDQAGILLLGTGSQAESTLPLGVVSQLLHDERLPDNAVASMTRLLTEVEFDGDQVEVTRIGPGLAKVANALCAVVLEAAKERTVVIAVDDLHFADVASVQVMLYLMRRIRSARVVVALTHCSGRRACGPRLHAEVSKYHPHEITLGLLGEAGIAQLVMERVGTTGPDFARGVLELTGGNPLLVSALLDDQSGVDVEGASRPVVGERYDKAAIALLHRGEPWMLDVARGLAVLGDRATERLVERLLGVAADVRAAAVHVLQEAGLLVDLRLRHPRMASAVLENTPLDVRVRLQLDAAELLHQHGCPALDVARLLVAADEVASRWAVPVLRVAADQALVDDDVETAIRCLTLALSSCLDERNRVPIMVALARLEWRLNPAAAALRLEPLRDKLFAGELTGQDAGAVVRHLLWQGEVDVAIKALSLLDRPEDAQVAAELRLVLQTIYGRRRGVAEPARAQVVRDAVPVSVNPWTRAATSLAAMVHRGVRDEIVTSANHLLTSCELDDSTLEVAAAALLALVYSDKLDAAATRCEPLLEEASRRGAATWQAVLGSVRAEIALRQGDLAMAEARARSALTLMHPQSWGLLIGGPLATLITANTAMGRPAVAAAMLRQVVPDAMTETVAGVRYLHARGQYHLATDRVLAAFADFQACGRLMAEWDVDRPSFVPWRSDLAQVQLRIGRRKSARDLVTEQLERPGDMGPRAKGISLRVLASGTELRQRPPLLREAIDLLQSAGDRLELTRALADLSQVHHELGEFGRARMTAHRAEQEAKACRADIGSTRVLRLAGGERAEPAAAEPVSEQVLSDAERRVATLAALGHTNREIGQRLYITPSTVEQHLTRVYRKLNVNGRKDLPAGLSPAVPQQQ